jgi:ATP-binding cassette subfamily F protein 3
MYEFEMNQPQNQTDADKMLELTGLYDATKAKLDDAYEQWEKLNE